MRNPAGLRTDSDSPDPAPPDTAWLHRCTVTLISRDVAAEVVD